MSQHVQFNSELIRKYDVSGPRYTSYPTAVQFHEGFTSEDYQQFAAASNTMPNPVPLSMYVHLPFCHSLCYYCGCTKKITRHREHGERYLATLFREIEMQGSLFDRTREVRQLHFGGGTPTFFDDLQLQELMKQLARHFNLVDDNEREYSIELDPRTVDLERLQVLQDLGFNRISLGIQDFDPDVQRAVNRIQGVDETLSLISGAHELGFDSVSVDLIYGLPLQSVDKFMQTLQTVVSAQPERLAVYNYAHMPQLFRAQRLIRLEDIPTPATKLKLMELTINFLTNAGYQYIGMDHFALPDDELARAQESGSLQRNFQGYSTHGDLDLVGLGVSSIGRIGNCFVQNLKTLPEYMNAVDDDELPIWRGLVLSAEDRLRSAVIQSIMCRGELVFSEFEDCYGIDFRSHFSKELYIIAHQHGDGLLTMGEGGFSATPAGRLLLRNIAMVFDAYLKRQQSEVRFSRAI
jgi:oxygen-independent coproporphyrinogen-3 oxidase